MSTEDDGDGVNVLRLREIKSYLRGEAPSLSVLAKAPQLRSWRLVIADVRTADDRPRLLMVLVGHVSGHPHFIDGRFIRTSELIWLDRNRNWARSWNRVYQLGAASSDGAALGQSEV
ncbi:MAG: hypothetical protein EKK33_01365 [Bradyrhizobiaceae bacterium]|nr:MAG: hypothetical protein EKK33_01365 [Bradyrhizobiaceae bacterium]